MEKLCSRFNFLFVLCESCVMVANLDLYQFAMPSTGWSNAVFRRAYYSYQSHLYFEATSLWLFTTQPIPIVGLLIS